MRHTSTRRPRITLAALALLCVAFSATPSAQAQTAVVFSAANTFAPVPSSTGGGFGGTLGRPAANTRGDIFGYTCPYNCSNTDYVIEIPAGGGTPVTLIDGINPPYGYYGAQSAIVDNSNNVYVSSSGTANILYIPFVNGTYPAGASYSTLPTCASTSGNGFPVSPTQTTACIIGLNYPSAVGYYLQTADLGLDGSGNLYLLGKYCGSGCPGDVLVKFSVVDGSSSVLNNTLGGDGYGNIAVDKAGDILLKDNGYVLFYAAGNYANANPPNVNNLQNPQGVSADFGGNFYINDSTNYGNGNNFIEIPTTGGSVNVNNNFIVSNQVGTGYNSQASQPLGIDGFGTIYYAGGNELSNTYANSTSYLVAGKLSFGTQTVGNTSNQQSLNVVFNAAESAVTMQIVGPANTFAVTYSTCGGGGSVGGNCGVGVTYTATAAGAQSATLQALDANNNILGTAVLSGIGIAPVLNVDPGTLVTDGTGYTAPSAVAVDASGNIFVADSSTGSIYKTSTGSAATATAVATGFNAPSSVAVDGAGNLYVADSGNLQVVEVPYNATTTTYGAPTVLVTGLSGTTGLALDAAGDLYVADSGNARVLRLSANSGQSDGSIVTPFGTGFTTPVAVAVDNTGSNVYVADAGSRSVVQIGVYSLTQANVVSGLNIPSGIATDATGSLYVVDSGAATVTRIPNVGGAINNNQATSLATVKLPTAIATDNAGNLYVVDTADQTVATDTRSTAVLNFGYVNENQTSSTIAAQVSNGGDAAINFNTPYQSQTNTTNFTLQSATTCADGGTINQGASCAVAASFSPGTTTGPLYDNLTFSSNANDATLQLSGYGTNAANTTTTLSVTSPTTPPAFGQPVTVKATVAPVSGSGTPMGTVTFYLDNVPQLTTPALVNGAASYTFTGLTGGQHTINASYSGDIVNYASSNTNANPLIITVGTTTSTTSVTLSGSPALFTNPTSAYPGQTVTFTALITPGAPGIPTGSVFFYNGSTQLNATAATVVPVTINQVSYGQATFTTSTLAAGQYSITAQYSGDTNYGGSTSSPGVPLLISIPTVSLTSGSTSISGGGSITLTIPSIAGYNGAVDLACLGLPAYATCSFSPAVAVTTPAVTAVITMKVFVNQPPAIAPGNAGLAAFNGRLGLLLATLLLLPLATLARKRKFGHALLTLLLLCGLAASLTGCGSTGVNANYVTPAGTYPITVTATIGPATLPGTPVVAATLPLTLTVN